VLMWCGIRSWRELWMRMIKPSLNASRESEFNDYQNDSYPCILFAG
jgi:hypothetical protein